MAKFAAHHRTLVLLCSLACLLIASSASAGPPLPNEGLRDSASANWSKAVLTTPESLDAAPSFKSTSSVVNDGSFELGSPNPNWTVTSSNGSPIICSGPTCGASAPRTGEFMAWFGAFAAAETSSLSQIFPLNAGDDLLSFWIRIDNCESDGSNTDVFRAKIGSTVLFEIDETSPRCGIPEHQRIVLDISAFADGFPYLLEFEFTGFGPGITNIYLDDVEIVSSIETAVNPADGGLEGGTPNSAWSETSTQFGTPICDTHCGLVFDPRTGTFGAWFGGFPGAENSTLGQILTLPVDQTALSFWLKVERCDDDLINLDTFHVKVDSVPVLTLDETSDLCDSPSYVRQIVDISPWADGGMHEISFEYGGFGPGNTNFFVDDIEILSSLEAYYPFDHDSQDHSPNGRHATLEGGASIGAGHVGDGALDLRGVDGWADIVDPVLDRHTECTLAYSVQIESLVPGSPGDNCCNAIFAENEFALGALHNNLAFHSNPDTLEWDIGGFVDRATIPAPTFAPTSWMHVAMTYRASTGRAEVYQNGILVETHEDTGPLCGSGMSSQIGAWESGGIETRFFDGSLDEVWIYSRVLSAEEIKALAPTVFADGFESGDLSGWSTSVGTE